MAAPKYRGQHLVLRAAWKAKIDRGEQPPCSRCGWPIMPGDEWDLDHTEDGTAYLGPACQSCNRRAGAVKRNRLYRRTPQARTPRTNLDW